MYLVSYDISSNKLRNKVAKKLKNYGKRVQFSVFECDIDTKDYKRMYQDLLELTFDLKDGSVRIYQLDMIHEKKLIVLGNANYIAEYRKEGVYFI